MRPRASLSDRGRRRSDRQPDRGCAGKRSKLQLLGQDPHVLVATPGDVHDDYLVFAHLRSALHTFGNRVRRLERGHNPFGSRQHHAGIEGFGIRCSYVLSASGIVQRCMFRADRRIVETSRDGVSGGYLPGVVLQNVRICSLQNSRRSSAKASGMLSQLGTSATGLNPDQTYLLIWNELVESAHRVRATADACDNRTRKLSSLGENLFARFASNATMKVAYHFGIGMRP